MKRKILSYIVLAVLLLFLAGLSFVLWTAEEPPPASEVPRSQGQRKQIPVQVRGLSFANYQGEQLLSRIRVADFRVKPRNLGIFRVKSVNEAALREVQFHYYQTQGRDTGSEDLSLGKQLSASVEGLAGLKGVGRITRVVMDGMEMKVSRKGRLHFEARAKKATMKIQKKSTRLEEVILTPGGGGQSLFSKVAYWDDNAQVFRIPGEYRLLTSQGRSTGTAVTVDLDFRIQPAANVQ